jgi:glycosyltransferase involved in cell wall biosynthesis
MKIIYISSNNINRKRVDVNQTLSTITNLAEYTNITYLSSWISKKNLLECFNFFSISNGKYNHKRVFINVSVKYFFLEKISRLIYCIFALFYLKFNNYDAILTRDFSFLYFLSLIPVFLKPKQKIIFESHKIYHQTSKKVSFEQEKRALNEADFFVTNSGGTKKGLIDYFGISNENIEIVHNGVNLNNFYKRKIEKNDLLKDYNFSAGDKIIIYTGSFKEWKGVEYLIKSAKYIRINNYKIFIIGGYGDDLIRIKELVRSLECDNKIIIKGFIQQEELLKLLSISDLAIIPNNKSIEGSNYTSPIKTFEYLAMGLPIIASSLPAMHEILTENKNVLFFEPENEKDLGLKISMLLNNKELLMKISKNNLKKAKEFSWNNRAKKIHIFIKKSLLN